MEVKWVDSTVLKTRSNKILEWNSEMAMLEWTRRFANESDTWWRQLEKKREDEVGEDRLTPGIHSLKRNNLSSPEAHILSSNLRTSIRIRRE